MQGSFLLSFSCYIDCLNFNNMEFHPHKLLTSIASLCLTLSLCSHGCAVECVDTKMCLIAFQLQLQLTNPHCTYTTRLRQFYHPPQAHGFIQHMCTSRPLNSLPSHRIGASLKARVKRSHSAAHPWLANSQIGTGIYRLYGWNSGLLWLKFRYTEYNVNCYSFCPVTISTWAVMSCIIQELSTFAVWTIEQNKTVYIYKHILYKGFICVLHKT